MIKYIFPKFVKEANGIEGLENLLLKQELQIGLNEKHIALFNAGSSIVLDFGKEIRGGIRILSSDVKDLKYAKIRIRFGESLAECYSNIGENNATNDHSPRDIYGTLSSWSDTCFGDTGFRFVRIDLLSEERIYIKSIVAKSYERNDEPRYVYDGNDTLIKDIYDAAKRTIDLCSVGKYVYDGIKRDRLVWVGDMYPEMLALTTLYGRSSNLERSLDFAKKQYPIPEIMYGMPTYSLWWVSIVSDYYAKTKNEQFIKKQLKYLNEQLKLFDSRIEETGKLNINNYFVDWPTVNHKDEYIGAICIAIIAYKSGINLLKQFDYDVSSFEKTLQNLYKNDFTNIKQKQVIGLKYFALGSIGEEDYNNLIDDRAKGFSTFMSYFILKAIASRDEHLAIELMKDYYGAMLKLGATTFFEDFNLDWIDEYSSIETISNTNDFHKDHGAFCYQGLRHSLCHGWASGVLTFMEEHIK